MEIFSIYFLSVNFNTASVIMYFARKFYGQLFLVDLGYAE